MKPNNFLAQDVDASVIAKLLDVTSRSVRKARQGKNNETAKLVASMSPKELGDMGAKAREIQEQKDADLRACRAPRNKNRYFTPKKKKVKNEN